MSRTFRILAIIRMTIQPDTLTPYVRRVTTTESLHLLPVPKGKLPQTLAR